nr:hypothetical protein Iba_chr02cCG5880 [Ipomoea batatas]
MNISTSRVVDSVENLSEYDLSTCSLASLAAFPAIAFSKARCRASAVALSTAARSALSLASADAFSAKYFSLASTNGFSNLPRLSTVAFCPTSVAALSTATLSGAPLAGLNVLQFSCCPNASAAALIGCWYSYSFALRTFACAFAIASFIISVDELASTSTAKKGNGASPGIRSQA